MDNIEKKKNKIIIYIVVIVLIVMGLLFIGFGYFFNKKEDNSNKILVYTNKDKELKYISNKNDKPILLSKSFDETINIKFNSNKTKIAYIKDSGLYLNTINSNKESIKLGVDVSKYWFMNNNLIYIDTYNNLFYTSSANDKEKIDIDVSDVKYNINDLIIYSKGEEIYSFNIKTREKNSILKDFDAFKNLILSNDSKKILYVSKEKKLNIYNLNSKSIETKDENVYEVVDYSKDLSNIVYLKYGENKKVYDLLINDKPEDNPIQKYQCTKYGTKSGYYDYNSYYNLPISDVEHYVYHLWYDAFYDEFYYKTSENNWELFPRESLKFCDGEDPQAGLKDEIRKAETTIQLYNINRINNDEKIELATNIYNVKKVKDNNVVYTKLDLNDSQKVKISTLLSVDDLENILKQVQPNLYYSSDKSKDNLIFNSFNKLYDNTIRIINNKIYFNDLKEDKVSLYEYDISKNNKEIISEKGFIIDDVKSNEFDIFYIDNYNFETQKGDLTGRKNNKNISIDIDVYYSLESDGKNYYYYKDFDSKLLNGNYVINNIKTHKKEIISNITGVYRSSNNKYYVFKDYSETSNTYSLFIYEKGKMKSVEYNITGFLYSY